MTSRFLNPTVGGVDRRPAQSRRVHHGPARPGQPRRPDRRPGHHPQVAVGLLVRHGWQTQDLARAEVLRYLGCSAQAVAYKIGEREWLQVRAQARQRIPGSTNRQFHAAALQLGAPAAATPRT
jgi:Bacterial protein of unknown function (DUF885)